MMMRSQKSPVLGRDGRWEGQRVAVLGLGRSGRGACRLLYARGAQVVAVDDRSEGELVEARRELGAAVHTWHLGDDAHEVGSVDAVVVSPGVPRDDPRIASALRDGRSVVGELELASRLVPGPMVAVTGTNGKSTTVTLVRDMFAAAECPVRLVGNIGRAISEEVLDLTESDTVVVEVSSFQLELIETFHPQSAAVLNVAPDHMNRYRSFEDYAQAKKNLLQNLQAGDAFVRPARDTRLEAWSAETSATTWSFGRDLRPGTRGSYVRDGAVRVNDGERDHEVLPVDAIPLLGAHNLQNVLAAVALAASRGVDVDACGRAIRAFRALAHRAVDVPSSDGIRWINDSKATNVHAAVATARGLGDLGTWLLGGSSKGEDFGALREVAARAQCVVCFGAEGPRIARELSGVTRVEVQPTMAAALEYLDEHGPAGDNVLLSPACASFDEFESFEQRGEFFAQWVRERRGGGA